MVYLHESTEDYKNALSCYKTFSQINDSINALRFGHQLNSMQEKYKIELQAQKDSQRNRQTIWGLICGTIILGMGIFVSILLIRRQKYLKQDAEQKAKIFLLENQQLNREKANLQHDKTNLELENERQQLIKENLSHRVELLEEECRSLKAIVDEQKELPAEVQDALRTRIEMLNKLVAGYIASNEAYEKACYEWIKDLTGNLHEFMTSNRQALQMSHPKFIQYFEEQGLTKDEINYVCLYAIGLKGKEVGKYMKRPGHVNMSSAIRKKLGIDKHETNIGIYVRKLLKEL